jgi:hypothetical protein
MASKTKPAAAPQDDTQAEDAPAPEAIDDGLRAQLVDHMAHGNPYVPPTEQPAED